MGIFDNAKSILIGSKEVKSIEVDGGTIWEKTVEPSSRTIQLLCYIIHHEDRLLGSDLDITLNGVTKHIDNNGIVIFEDVPDGEYTAFVTNNLDINKSAVITVDADHTNMEVTFS